jgi:aryl-alcohol dehydrogenase-like predicted oxidoreductase
MRDQLYRYRERLFGRALGGDHRQALKNLKIPRKRGCRHQSVWRNRHGGVNSRGSSRYHIISSVKESLRRLQLDHIDLYQLHGFDPATPIEETLYALDNLVQHGHVRYIGVRTGRPGKLPKRWAFPSVLGWRVLRLCRRITPLPDATWSASWCR